MKIMAICMASGSFIEASLMRVVRLVTVMKIMQTNILDAYHE